MAMFETWLRSDLQKPVTVKALDGNLFSADNEGNLIGVEVYNNGQPESLSGSVIGYLIRADNETVVVYGTLLGNKASIVLPKSAYVVIGKISIVIKVGKTTVGACVSNVYRSTTDVIVDPEHVVPDLSDLLVEIDNMRNATHDANIAIENANTATESANVAASSANIAAGNANEKAQQADIAASNANTKADLADDAAANANTKANLANDAAVNANAKAEVADTAAENANSKAALANTAATNANEKAGLADTAATNANTKAELANDAATLANSKAELAQEAANNANTKAEIANTSASNADTKASLADAAATNANTKAGLANEAADLANSKAEIADDAATLANTKAEFAQDAADLANSKATIAQNAADNANAKAALANSAAEKIDNMTVDAAGGIQPIATISEVDGHKHISFTIPKGDKGDKGKDFHIAFTFVSVAAMESYSGEVELFDYAMIDTGNVEDAETGRLYCYEEDNLWHYIGDLSGAQGIKGETGTGIASVQLNSNYTLTINYDDGTSTTTGSIRGEKGEKGDATVVSTQVTEYQESTSGTVIPSGTWSENIPAVTQGNYLWMRHTIVWNDDNNTETVFYGAYRMGRDGAGSVVSALVNDVPVIPDENGVLDFGVLIREHQDISGKADKDIAAVEGNFAQFDAYGNPVDSGHKHSDYDSKLTELESTVSAIISGLPTEETAQELLSHETANTSLTDLELTIIGMFFNNLPSDETAIDITHSLELECERLQSIYNNWINERSV